MDKFTPLASSLRPLCRALCRLGLLLVECLLALLVEPFHSSLDFADPLEIYSLVQDLEPF